MTFLMTFFDDFLDEFLDDFCVLQLVLSYTSDAAFGNQGESPYNLWNL
jgi:hypothetical protein